MASEKTDALPASAVPQGPAPETLTFKRFSAVNRERCESPQGFNHQLPSWSTSDWFLAILGELGEAANVAKKLNRVRDGIPGNTESPEALRVKLRKELGDTFVYLDLISQALGFNIGDAAVDVFNAKSEEIGCPIKINPLSAPPAEERIVSPPQLAPDTALDVYIPGRWKCPKCSFVLSQATMFVASGTIGHTRDQVMRMDGELCPNDGTPMARVTWREESEDNYNAYVKLVEELCAVGRVSSLPEAIAKLAAQGSAPALETLIKKWGDRERAYLGWGTRLAQDRASEVRQCIDDLAAISLPRSAAPEKET